ncbi:bifunctional N-acetylglucosamine-1-phosphate uridyltransferase/glucosamine-1-phosphate acetyltransferase [Maricaulis sp. W15]|uniref:bifunctional UDP-N-acetylglucosamine diphosphorylase/glucosamine-1-phosphate N-acetyltransferase GlmU n=1 Tax=Maricaulis sp. W15 TaxID=1772333 RepID=UPI000948C4FA|nr:bifunctional UDP-N-acetylglucosamine diphosphorylase/glucosamine-1-phosphate N-acetyltransferase GlmU [Maricaulis sp. W15]OLF72244.1 bifunctional N-acetylglucosamine-1-phosphate uridyltransferase/glucosamine-1-phosphate acetyltransferase [Maricaulis sp. W15]
MSRSRAAIILAAGQGTRMKSKTVKVLHKVGGRPMLDWAVALAADCGACDIVTVWGAHSPAVRDAAEALGTRTALQDPPKGTGHAVQAARAALTDLAGDAIVLYADTPLITAATVARVFEALEGGASVAVLGFEPEDPAAYGRLITNADGDLDRIVEYKDANEAERAVGLVNSGVLAAPAELLFDLLAEVTNDNANGEYYLTDVVGLARKRNLRAAVVVADADEVLGVNSRADLAEAEAAFQARMRAQMMADGVTLIAPETVFFAHDTKIERDVVIEPNVVFGPGVVVEEDVVIHAHSHVEGAHLKRGAHAGPFARLRPGAELGEGSKVGNFVEIKKSQLAEGAKVSHLTYIGDASIGANANIGAGTITCNYDGYDKHRTVIGDNAFIGSNTCLVAPVTVGAGAFTATGTIVTEDVPADALALARTPQTHKPGWAARFHTAKQARKARKDSQT